MFGVGADDESTDDVDGIQVIPILLGADQEQAAWAVLTWAAMAGDFGTELLQERLTGVIQAFSRYWTPSPALEEQKADLVRARNAPWRARHPHVALLSFHENVVVCTMAASSDTGLAWAKLHNGLADAASKGALPCQSSDLR